jgi:hypothetical protein
MTNDSKNKKCDFGTEEIENNYGPIDLLNAQLDIIHRLLDTVNKRGVTWQEIRNSLKGRLNEIKQKIERPDGRVEATSETRRSPKKK